MAFRVEVAPQALDDLDGISDHLTLAAGFAVAQRWFNGMMDAIRTLEQFPARCPVAPESRALGREVRVLLHGRKGRAYKIFYEVWPEGPEEGVVRVFHVRHWARKPLLKDDLADLL